MKLLRYSVVGATIAVLMAAYAAAGHSSLPYETAAPHQQWGHLMRVLVAANDAVITVVKCQQPECDGNECKPLEPCGECTSYACIFTGNMRKFCVSDGGGSPPCEYCSTCHNEACRDPEI